VTTSQYLGLIFAVFMVCVMVGSSVFKVLSAQKENLYKIPLLLHGVAFLAMGSVALFLENKTVVYASFLIFEAILFLFPLPLFPLHLSSSLSLTPQQATVGLFYPAYGVIKSEKIPEDIRSAVMNIFRIPLNAFVVLLLLKIKFLSSKEVFLICTGTHLVALLCYIYFYLHCGKAGPPVSPTAQNEKVRRARAIFRLFIFKFSLQLN
jgi:hypothetical protein